MYDGGQVQLGDNTLLQGNQSAEFFPPSHFVVILIKVIANRIRGCADFQPEIEVID